jgi:predicted DNA-binding ribbon-helix-helix protein
MPNRRWEKKLTRLARKKTDAVGDETVKTSVRVAKETWARVRHLAIEENKTVHALLAEAIERLLEEKGGAL